MLIAVVQLLRCVRLFVTPWTAACQASLSFTISRSLLTLMSIELMMPSNHVILCPSLLPSIFPSIRVFSKESALRIRWPNYWSFSFTISPSSEYQGCIPLGLADLTSYCPRDSEDLHCGMWNLNLQHVGSSSLTRDQTETSYTGSLSHWTTREGPFMCLQMVFPLYLSVSQSLLERTPVILDEDLP